MKCDAIERQTGLCLSIRLGIGGSSKVRVSQSPILLYDGQQNVYPR